MFIILPLLTVVALSAAGGNVAQKNDETPPPATLGALRSATWEISVLSYRLTGACCWLSNAQGFTRLEIQRQDQTDHQPSLYRSPVRDLKTLFHQRGDGWTVVLGADAQGVHNRWGREWHRLPKAMNLTVRAILEELATATVIGGGAGRAWLPRRPGSVARGRRLELPPLELEVEDPAAVADDVPPATFRRRLTERGAGRGEQGEILSLDWTSVRPAAAKADSTRCQAVLEVRSTRRPGVLRLVAADAIGDVPYLDPEIFTPLWPLRDLVRLPGASD